MENADERVAIKVTLFQNDFAANNNENIKAPLTS